MLKKYVLCCLLAGLLCAACGPGDGGWGEIEQEARGSDMVWYMFGNSEAVNRYVDEFVTPEVYARYGIVVRRVPVNDMSLIVQDLVKQKQSGNQREGRADLLWINGADFNRAREAGALFGPWARDLPNARHVTWSDASVANDLGLPVAGYEAPWGQSAFLLLYDSARVPDPPRSIAAMERWVRAHPGRFTYPQPPDPEGSAFLRQVFYELAGGPGPWLRSFNEVLYRSRAQAVWGTLRRMAPFLWRRGQSYPVSARELEQLYVAGEVDFCFSYNPGQAWRKVAVGLLPGTTRAYCLEQGTLASTHYVAIPYNAPHKAAAMVVANFLQSPQAQAEKARPGGWGDLPVVAPQLLRPAQTQVVFAVEGWSTPIAALEEALRLPEPCPDLAKRLDSDWAKELYRR